MPKSKLEEEVVAKIVALKFAIARHDRAVIFGFILSLLPIFPSAIFGTLVGLFNFRLVACGKLEAQEAGLVRKGILIGSINSVISIVLLYWLLHFLNEVGWQQFTHSLLDSLWQFFSQLLHFNHPPLAKTTV